MARKVKRLALVGGAVAAVAAIIATMAVAAAPMLREEDEEKMRPASVRQLAKAAGLESLSEVRIPEPGDLDAFLQPGPEARQNAVVLGKALFWDMQVGSDGQACASCHFAAGADNRSKNQISPGLKNTDASLQTIFSATASGSGGPNYTLKPEDFPFHKLEDPEEEDYSAREVLFDSDDVVSSQGVFGVRFQGVAEGYPTDAGAPVADNVYNVGAVNVRRVEPRNTPTMINAVFNFANFWDGRAHNVFNGVSPLGPLDAEAFVWVNGRGELAKKPVSITNASLASQAVGPPLSDLEMSFFDRPFPEVGRKLLGVTPLGLQIVHPNDSILGSLSRAQIAEGTVSGQPGLNTSYETLIKSVFQPDYWDSTKPIDGYSQIEANFSLFFGLAIQMYESTLVSDRSAFDRFMDGDDGALDEEQIKGLLVFINRGPGKSDAPLFKQVGQGNCVSCHGGPEFTDAAFTSLAEDGEELEIIEVEESPEIVGGLLQVGDETVYLDNGFSNIGVRPTGEDIGRGGTEKGKPLSFIRQALAEMDFAPELPGCGGADEEECPTGNRVSVDGAFKVPGLRNVELTGPYFHNGGQATLGQVIEFYDRQGDFGDVNIANLDRNMARIAIGEDDEEPLVEFLLALTDPRVSNEEGPFDHPQLFIPNGHPGDGASLACVNGQLACDDYMEIPAVGAQGRSAAGLQPLGTFLGLPHLDDDSEEEEGEEQEEK
ncbi:MAG: cytochrome C peroxidase [Chloroflexi bacterium]|nr:cytochrome C peroxidase [Chloroflexota bacterium]